MGRRQEFFEREVSDGLKVCTPGEWVMIEAESGERFIGFANPFISEGSSIKVLKQLKHGEKFDEDSIAPFIERRLEVSLKHREQFKILEDGARLVFGAQDGLPGIIVDEYESSILIQINTAGFDRYREVVFNTLEKLTAKPCYFFDQAEYRSKEGLPIHSSGRPDVIRVKENDLSFEIDASVLQKLGYYYDHRVNRSKLQQWLSSIEPCHKKKGVDLFSYCGSWGMNALNAGVAEMSFVDQGNFEACIEKNLSLNNFSGRGLFHRGDVFKWLKECETTFDVVISDPPAFSKSLKSKSKALGGYQKLHASLSKIVHKGSWLAIGSCTQGVSLEELDQTVALGFNGSPLQLSLVDVGLQGPDHRVGHLSDAGSYIKFLLYRVN
jgi:23S rRNA (cytosine1962-C5)-methyltransferase